MLRINLWSSPRNISTALMYSFAQRPDTTIVDEPLYAYYLTHTNSLAVHPGTAEILQSQNPNGEAVVQNVILGEYKTPVAVFKQMTHHLLPELSLDFLLQTTNVLLIRDPRRIIASYTKVVQQPTIEDIGIQQQYDLFKFLEKNNNLNAVVDARRLLENPQGVLEKLCEKVGIPFTKKMLHWNAGARPEDGVWAKYWYGNVHQSTGFQPYVHRDVDLDEKMEKLAETCQPYYDYLLLHSL